MTPPERWESRPEPASPWIDALHAEIATVSDQAKRIEALEAEIERMREPDIYWLADDPEIGLPSTDDLAGHHDLESGVHQVTCAAELPARWIAVEKIDEWVTDPTGLVSLYWRGETNVTEHLTEAEADAALLTTQEGAPNGDQG